MRNRTIALFPLLALAAFTACASGVPEEELKDFGKGIITDYSNMQEGEDIQWYWIAPGTKLADHHCTLASSENLTTTVDHDLRDVLKEELPEVIQRACSRDASAPPLKVDTAVYWTERANTAKAWIPFAGGHLMQAGVGMEVVFKDTSGKIVAKIRQSGREGHELKDAAREIFDDIGQFVREH